MIDIEPVQGPLGARILNVDLAKPVSDAVIASVENALEQYGVIVFPRQSITPTQQVAFSRAFADLEMTQRVDARLDEHPEIFVVGNTGKKLVSFAPNNPNDPVEWHADHMHLPAPARASLLYALEVPSEGADTLFTCTYRAFDSLSPEQQLEAKGLIALHSVSGLRRFLREQGQPGAAESRYESGEALVVKWPLVRHHPRSRRPSLYFGSQVSIGIEGWTPTRGLAYIDELSAIASRPENIYRHKWQAGDAILWDNRRTLHAGTPFDLNRYRRRMHRTTWREDAPIQ